ncbi:hypothetical protein VOLCADRAFT_94384 [Volvox carteri f. nagariensis]|uniref:Uncharacterized protein n=1 Tax=Volvox carteri f. nagariensis TaxID=3068 RepID=D8U4M7_VOLCA|nr:uncharacterized protein VOLCADRAFT_94384 [Volvox carteri f. nagariensis]EFJ45301.1 hypothetical protein VOLCADRAFT_94384 [Volvox carteri f. nagariensis]|eukprot:XP_002953677.1 hypothetical protein VOLCADRAFT_94384 [Volvox carteri f. nagariensis]
MHKIQLPLLNLPRFPKLFACSPVGSSATNENQQRKRRRVDEFTVEMYPDLLAVDTTASAGISTPSTQQHTSAAATIPQPMQQVVQPFTTTTAPLSAVQNQHPPTIAGAAASPFDETQQHDLLLSSNAVPAQTGWLMQPAPVGALHPQFLPLPNANNQQQLTPVNAQLTLPHHLPERFHHHHHHKLRWNTSLSCSRSLAVPSQHCSHNCYKRWRRQVLFLEWQVHHSSCPQLLLGICCLRHHQPQQQLLQRRCHPHIKQIKPYEALASLSFLKPIIMFGMLCRDYEYARCEGVISAHSLDSGYFGPVVKKAKELGHTVKNQPQQFHTIFTCASVLHPSPYLLLQKQQITWSPNQPAVIVLPWEMSLVMLFLLPIFR